MYGHRVALEYGLSVQGWGSWLATWRRSLGWSGGWGLLVMLMFWVIRRSPARWWFWFWIPAVAAVVVGVFVYAVCIDPLFNKFEPLAKTNPALVERLEQVVARGGIAIPPERMFLMKASAKSTELNAYVRGLGRRSGWWCGIRRSPSRRRTRSASSSRTRWGTMCWAMWCWGLRFVRGAAAALLAGIPRDASAAARDMARAWRIPSQQDWGGAGGAGAGAARCCRSLSEPITNGFSRGMEHNADVYGQEAVHGIVADPQAVAAAGLPGAGRGVAGRSEPEQVCGVLDVQPSVDGSRAAFAEAYDPWARGEEPKYFKK